MYLPRTHTYSLNLHIVTIYIRIDSLSTYLYSLHILHVLTLDIYMYLLSTYMHFLSTFTLYIHEYLTYILVFSLFRRTYHLHMSLLTILHILTYFASDGTYLDVAK